MLSGPPGREYGRRFGVVFLTDLGILVVGHGHDQHRGQRAMLGGHGVAHGARLGERCMTVSPRAISLNLGMSTNVKIEIDERTADVLHARAAELGVTVSELVAELATLDSAPIAVDSDEIAELDRRWKKIEAGQPTVPHERVVRWLRTWGTPRFRRWQDQ